MATPTDQKPWTHYRAQVAALTRDRLPNDPELLEARRNLRAVRLEEYVSRVVSEAPPLTDAQRDRIAALLRPTSGGDAA